MYNIYQKALLNRTETAAHLNCAPGTSPNLIKQLQRTCAYATLIFPLRKSEFPNFPVSREQLTVPPSLGTFFRNFGTRR